MSTFSSDTAARVAKLVPMLSSPVAGEVAATAAAIERTLKSGGSDWYDLAKRIAEPTIADLVVAPRPAPQPTWSTEKERERDAKRKTPEWPTWGRSSHFQRLAWMKKIKNSGRLSDTDAEQFVEFWTVYYRHQVGATRKNISIFNKATFALWREGARI